MRYIMYDRTPDEVKISVAAAEWVARRDAHLELAEQADFERWCAADPRHIQALARFEATWIAIGRPRRTGNSAVITRHLGELGRVSRRRWHFAGATLAMLMVVTLAWWTRRSPTAVSTFSADQTVVRVPEHRILSDGSVIELPVGSVVEVNYTDTARHVILERGEAYFKVAKNPLRPFIVSVEGFEVRAVGTAFCVQLGKPDVEVLVTEGRVTVGQSALPAVDRSARFSHSPLSVVDAGTLLVLKVPQQSAQATLAVRALSTAEMTTRLAWRNPQLEFSGASLASVVAVVNRYNRTHFILEDSLLSSVPVSGIFRADDTDAFVDMLEAGFGIKAERLRDDQILLRKAF